MIVLQNQVKKLVCLHVRSMTMTMILLHSDLEKLSSAQTIRQQQNKGKSGLTHLNSTGSVEV